MVPATPEGLTDGKPRHGYGTLAVMVPERPFEVVPEHVPEHAPEVERRIRETVESLLLS